MKTKNHILILLALGMSNALATPLPNCQSDGTEINGNFDLPAMSSGTWQLRNEAIVPHWSAISGTSIEFWRPTFINPISPSGGNRTEVQGANSAGYFLNFDSGHIPGTVVDIKFEHAARTGTGNDTLDVFASEGGGARTLIVTQTSTQAGGPAWSIVNSEYVVPSSGYTNMRITFDPRDGGSSGNLMDGVVIRSLCDYGDAPAGYPSASNTINERLFIGTVSRPSDELADQPSAAATSDSGDNGVSSFPGSAPDATYSVDVDLTNTTGSSAELCGYIDFGQDGNFEGDETVCTTVANGATSATLNWTVPSADRTNSGNFVVRMQLTSNQAGANDGEVEDYLVPISVLPITLASINSHYTNDGIFIEWTTATESQNAGFYIEYQTSDSSQWTKYENLIPSKVISSLIPQSYQLTIESQNISSFRLIDIDTSGNKTYHPELSVGEKFGLNAVTNSRKISWSKINNINNKHSLSKSKSSSSESLIWVKDDGIQKFSYDDLAQNANFSAIANISEIAITDNGKPIARYINDLNGNGLFDSGDEVDFLGFVNSTLYANENAYSLEINSDKAVQAKTNEFNNIATTNQTYSHQYHEENQKTYSFASKLADPWFDEYIFANGGPASITRSFGLDGLDNGMASVELNLWGVTDFNDPLLEDHHLIAYINGEQVGEYRFDGIEKATLQFPIPVGLLNENSNELKIELPGDTGFPYDIIAFDSFSISYNKISIVNHLGEWTATKTKTKPVKISNAIGPTIAWKVNKQNNDVIFDHEFESWSNAKSDRITGINNTTLVGRGEWYLADSRGFKSPRLTAKPITNILNDDFVDYLIVSHPQFINSSSLTQLINLQQQRGYSTRLVNVEDIYAQSSDYNLSPDAIKAYLKSVNPKYILLVGADSYDYHDYLQQDGKSFIPTFYKEANSTVSFAPIDGFYTDYSETGNMDSAIGRLPVRTVEELETVVNKLIQQKPYSSNVAISGPSEDNKLYKSMTQINADLLNSNIQQSLLSSDDLGTEETRTELISKLNDEAQVFSYFGHSSFSIWGLNRNNFVLNSEGASNLLNPNPHTILQWACWNTYFVDPQLETMADLFLKQTNGAANVFGATTLTEIGIVDGFNKVFNQEAQSGIAIGDIIRKTNNHINSTTKQNNSALLGFVLLGDPAAILYKF